MDAVSEFIVHFLSGLHLMRNTSNTIYKKTLPLSTRFVTNDARDVTFWPNGLNVIIKCGILIHELHKLENEFHEFLFLNLLLFLIILKMIENSLCLNYNLSVFQTFKFFKFSSG